MIVRLLIFLIFFIFMSGCLDEESSKVIIDFGNGTEIIATIAESSEDRSKGLMYKKALDDNTGMLFIFEKEGFYSFWMKNVMFPLDILWFDEELDIIHITEDIPPCNSETCEVYVSPNPSKYVLEVNSNFVRNHNINIGDRVSFNINKS